MWFCFETKIWIIVDNRIKGKHHQHWDPLLILDNSRSWQILFLVFNWQNEIFWTSEICKRVKLGEESSSPLHWWSMAGKCLCGYLVKNGIVWQSEHFIETIIIAFYVLITWLSTGYYTTTIFKDITDGSAVVDTVFQW